MEIVPGRTADNVAMLLSVLTSWVVCMCVYVCSIGVTSRVRAKGALWRQSGAFPVYTARVVP